MNDRPQLATADYQNGTVEFIHLTSFNTTVKSKYWLQIFDRYKGETQQRDSQILLQDQPLQYFFAFNMDNSKLNQVLSETENSAVPVKQTMIQVGNSQNITTSKISYELEPLDQNQVLLRVQNLADRFDDKREIGFHQYLNKGELALSQQPSKQRQNSPVYEVKYIDINQLANSLYFASVGQSNKLP